MTRGEIKIGISTCLLGERVRYDGGHKLDRFITETLGQYFQWVPVCPEVEYGLSVPREEMRLVGDPASPRLVTRRTGVDHTRGMLKWTERRLEELEGEELCGFIFKSRSPSSGIGGVKVYTPSGMPSKRGAGIFGGAFTRRFPLIPVEDDGRLHNPALRENFIERIFVFRRWRDFLRERATRRGLVAFHTRQKLLVLAHSPSHYKALGRLVADAKKYRTEVLLSEYIGGLMEGLRLLATVKKNTNVLLHTMGYFRKQLTADEKRELLEVIENYHRGFCH